jgi:hypothetical protein
MIIEIGSTATSMHLQYNCLHFSKGPYVIVIYYTNASVIHKLWVQPVNQAMILARVVLPDMSCKYTMYLKVDMKGYMIVQIKLSHACLCIAPYGISEEGSYRCKHYNFGRRNK